MNPGVAIHTAGGCAERHPVVKRADLREAAGYVALEAQAPSVLGQELIQRRSMGIVAVFTPLLDGLVLPDEWAPDLGVAFETGLLPGGPEATGPLFAVDIVAIGTPDMALFYRVPVGHAELYPDIEVAVETGIGIFAEDKSLGFRASLCGLVLM